MSRGNLIQFQERLAKRLNEAQQAEAESRWLAVVAGGEHILLPLAQAGEISSSVDTLTPLPHAHAWFAGLVNLRGVLCGVVDLGLFLGATRSPRTPGHARLVQFSPRLDINAALLVDQLAGLRTPDQFVLDPHAPVAQPPWLGPGLRDATGQAWRELDLACLVDDPRFLQVV